MQCFSFRLAFQQLLRFHSPVLLDLAELRVPERNEALLPSRLVEHDAVGANVQDQHQRVAEAHGLADAAVERHWKGFLFQSLIKRTVFTEYPEILLQYQLPTLLKEYQSTTSELRDCYVYRGIFYINVPGRCNTAFFVFFWPTGSASFLQELLHQSKSKFIPS